MAKVLILYSTTDGHTIEICKRIKQTVEAQGYHACKYRTSRTSRSWYRERLTR